MGATFEEGLTLIEEFVEAEHALAHAAWTEQDDQAYWALLKAFNQRVAKHAWALFEPAGRVNADMDGFEGEDVEFAIGNIRKRTVFAAVRWTHSAEGAVLTAFADRPSAQLTSQVSVRLHLLLDRDPPVFVALESSCSSCLATGQSRFSEDRCGHCHGRGWTGYNGNLPLGAIVDAETLHLLVPRDRLSERDETVLGRFGL